MNECLYCGSYYLRYDSLSRNSTEEGSFSFCSREHEDKFKEEQDAKIAAWKKDNPNADSTTQAVPAEFPQNMSIGDLLKNMHNIKGVK